MNGRPMTDIPYGYSQTGCAFLLSPVYNICIRFLFFSMNRQDGRSGRMKKKLNIMPSGLQKKTVIMVLVILTAIVAVFLGVSGYQNRELARIVSDTRSEQTQAISDTSKQTMHGILTNTMINTTLLQAQIADNDFSEIVNDIYMLQTMAQDLLDRRSTVEPAAVALPDPALDGQYSAMVLHEEGVNYKASKDLPVLGNMTAPLIAMASNSDKIDGCYIGLADGTHLGVDHFTRNKYDEDGNLIPFPVRQRPWYTGAVESGGLYFTGIEKDAFSGVPMITCSIPVVSNGRTAGVIGIDIMMDNMNDFIASSADNGGFAFVINSSGQVVLAPENNGLFEATTSDQAEDLRKSDNKELAEFAEKALKETTELTLLTIDGKKYYMTGSPMPTVGWAVISVVSQEVTEQPEVSMLSEYERINTEASAKFREKSAQANQTALLIITLIFIFSICGALIGTGRIVKPLKEMTDTITDSSKTGDLFEMKEIYRTNDEIEVLAESFADLSRKTKQYIEDITQITKEKERVNTELNMANQIQSSMLPHIFPAFPNKSEFDIYASMNPAKEVGGDFYDFFLIDDDHLCMVIADVSGKGVPAALFMMISKVILQSCAMLGKSAAEILQLTNDALCSSNQVEMFVTVWVGILEISTGVITAANAGHEYPALSQNGYFSLLKDPHGFIIGGMEDMKYKEYEIRMKPGDRLFLYTDGVPEATDADQKMFGTERMLQALNKEPDADPKTVLKNVYNAVDAFVQDAEQFDDLTMLCIEYRGADQRS